MVAHNPLNRSGRAGYPHPALASGDNAEAAQGIWVIDAGRGQPAVNQAVHPLPANPAFLAAARERAVPQPGNAEPEEVKCGAVYGHAVVSAVSLHNRRPTTCPLPG